LYSCDTSVIVAPFAIYIIVIQMPVGKQEGAGTRHLLLVPYLV